MRVDLSFEEAAALPLLVLLTRVIDEDRYPLTPRIQSRTSPLPPGSTWRSPRVSSRRRRRSR